MVNLTVEVTERTILQNVTDFTGVKEAYSEFKFRN